MTKEELLKVAGEARGLKIITRHPEDPAAAVIDYTGVNFNQDEQRFEVIRSRGGATVARAEPLSADDIKKITINENNWLILDLT